MPKKTRIILFAVGGCVILVFGMAFVGISILRIIMVQREIVQYRATQAENKQMVAEMVTDGPRDKIPAINEPKYENERSASEWLLPNDIVFGMVFQGATIAYPQRILVWHEIVNDVIGGTPVAITYCPLSGVVLGYRVAPRVKGDATFGVSGKLLNSNLVMYDRLTGSLWPQILGRAVSGEETGKRMKQIPVTWTTWEQWKTIHPKTKVLSRNTGFVRDYGVSGDPYGSYLRKRGYYFEDGITYQPLAYDRRLPRKEMIVGVRDEHNNAITVRMETLKEKGRIEAVLGNRPVVFMYNKLQDTITAQYKSKRLNDAPSVITAMWFVWHVFYPDAPLIQ